MYKKEGLSFFFEYLVILFQRILHFVDQDNSPGTQRVLSEEKFKKSLKKLGLLTEV
jgi:hypothetical protein